jgi:hypothetical protein
MNGFALASFMILEAAYQLLVALAGILMIIGLRGWLCPC